MEDLNLARNVVNEVGMNPFARYDWRVFLLRVKRWLWFFLLVIVAVAVALFLVLRTIQRPGCFIKSAPTGCRVSTSKWIPR